MVGRSNALAHAAADRVARHGGGQALYNPLFLHAGVGLGKTHLLHAVGHHARAQGRRRHLSHRRPLHVRLRRGPEGADHGRLQGAPARHRPAHPRRRAVHPGQDHAGRVRPHPQRPDRRRPPDRRRRRPPAGRSRKPRRARALAARRRPRGRDRGARRASARLDPPGPPPGGAPGPSRLRGQPGGGGLRRPHHHRERARPRRRGEPAPGPRHPHRRRP